MFEYFCTLMKNNAWASPIISGFTTALVASAAAMYTVKKQRQTARENNSLLFERDYKHNNEVTSSWSTLYYKAHKNKLTFPIVRYAEEEHSTTSEAIAIRYILNEWERAANAINQRLYDEMLLYRAFGSTVIFLRTEFSPYIYARQADNPSFYKQFMAMSLRWMALRSNEPDHKSINSKIHDACVCKQCVKIARKKML